MSNKESSFIKGATVLAAAGILSRVLGVFYKVPLYQMVGSYGNGLISNATTIYTLLLMVSTVGFPVAISKMISENIAIKDYRGANAVFKISFLALLVLGGAATLFLFFGAEWLISAANWDPETYPAIIAIALAPLVISICSSFRGFFQGFQIMTPTAISQIVEQIVRVGLAVFLCWFCVKNGFGVGMAAGGAVFGSTIGGIVAALILWFLYWAFTTANHNKLSQSNRKIPLTTKAIFKRLVIIAIPVTLTSAIVSVFSLIDSLIYVDRLAVAGIDNYTATTMFGDLSNADTLINIPLVISGTLAVAMIPAISESFALRDRAATNHKIDIAMRIVVMVALPCCVGLSVLSQGVFDCLFPESPFGPQILTFYSYATIFMMLSNTFQSILQGIDRFRVPLINLAVAVVLRFISGWICMAIPSLNIYGIVISSLITFVYLTIANYACVKRFTKVRIDMKQTVFKPLLASAVMGIITWCVYASCAFAMGDLISRRLIAIVVVSVACAVAIVVYGFIMILIGGITEEELALLPAQHYIEPIYRKIRNVLHKN
ncbi:MAG: polysaccharide biosynthesis protein [Eubacterium sp.]